MKPKEFKAFIPIDSLQTSGLILASIRGTFDSLKLQTNLHLAQTTYPGYSVARAAMGGILAAEVLMAE